MTPWALSEPDAGHPDMPTHYDPEGVPMYLCDELDGALATLLERLDYFDLGTPAEGLYDIIEAPNSDDLWPELATVIGQLCERAARRRRLVGR
jgi:hypothetical protein